MDSTKTLKKRGKYLKDAVKAHPITLGILLWTGELLVSFLLFFAALWYTDTYGDVGFDGILYTLTSSLGGVQAGLILDFCLCVVLPAAACAAVGCRILLRSLRRVLTRVFAVVLSMGMVSYAGSVTGLTDYLYDSFRETEIFENWYVAPDSVAISFPEEKRNLIYIYLESMEISYLSEELGGAQEENLIPELYTLARENLNFSHNSDVGGFLPVSGATWTVGSMVAHTAGIPLKTPDDLEDWQNGYGQEGEFLPGVTTLSDILHENGYYQALMVGSVASFGGRETYYETHGTDKVYGLSDARRAGIVPGDYFVWWGMEDYYLFTYARQELTKIAQEDQPFAFTLLTVDTHHVGGYVCEFCREEHEQQYENVISCSSRQVLEFVRWIQQQEFYENTTIVITGDHPSMDNDYFEENVDRDYTRRMYNCILNSPVDTSFSKNRSYCALDMFPTTLAAMGCTIPGDRLGLGTNLFSGTPTLIESMGYDRFDGQISMSSDYYAEKFRLEAPEEE